MVVGGSAGKWVENPPFVFRHDGHSGAKLSPPFRDGDVYGCLRRFALVPCQMILCVTVDSIVEVAIVLGFSFFGVFSAAVLWRTPFDRGLIVIGDVVLFYFEGGGVAISI